MELNFVSFEAAVTYSHEAPHHVVFGDLCDIEKYFKQYHYFHLLKVDGEVIESLM